MRLLPPQLYALFISGSCNLNCDYCYLPNRSMPDMSLEVAEAALDFIASRPSEKSDIGFFGVEPLLKPELIKWFIEQAPSRVENCGFSLNTNGLLFDEELCRMFVANKVAISLSLDGDALANDAHRKTKSGAGSFEILQKKLPLFIAYEPPVYIRMTLSPDNCSRVGELLENINRMGFRKAGFSFDFTRDFTEENLEGFRESLKKYAARYAESLLKGETGFKVATLEGAARRIHPVKGLFCGAGETLFAIDPLGSIYPCWRYAGEGVRKIGDVKEGLNEEELKFYREFDNSLFEGCEGCPKANRCARCLWVCEKKGGSPYKPTKEQRFFNDALLEAADIIAPALEPTAQAEKRKGGIFLTTDDGATYIIPEEEWENLCDETS